MNKTISVNISGYNFILEEQAYDRLHNYLEALKGHFNDGNEQAEIMGDIETRIAELLQAKLNESKQVITYVDIDEIINLMGHPEEIAGDAGDENDRGDHQEKKDYQPSTRSRKIYRDTVNSVIGGVCSGLGQFFGLDPVWMRIFFILLTIFGGSGILIYIILWIIIPEAKTTAEKLEMRGEPVNVDNIKAHANKFAEGVKDFDRRNRDKRRGAALQFGGVMGKIFGVFCLLVGIGMSIVLVYWLFAKDFVISITDNGMKAFTTADFIHVVMSSDQLLWLNIGLILFFLGPIVNLFNWGINLIFNIKSNIKWVLVGGLITWFIGVIILAGFGIDLGRDFKSANRQTVDVSIDQPQNDQLVITMQEDDVFSTSFTNPEDYFWELLKQKGDQVYLGWPELDFQPSNSDEYKVVLYKTARGRTQTEAIERVKDITYSVKQEGNTLSLSPYFSFHRDMMYRIQRVKVVVYVPSGKSVYLDKSLKRIDFDLDKDDEHYQEWPEFKLEQPYYMSNGELTDHVIFQEKKPTVKRDSTTAQDSIQAAP